MQLWVSRFHGFFSAKIRSCFYNLKVKVKLGFLNAFIAVLLWKHLASKKETAELETTYSWPAFKETTFSDLCGKISIYSTILSAIWVPHGQLWDILKGDSFTHPMLTTVVYNMGVLKQFAPWVLNWSGVLKH